MKKAIFIVLIAVIAIAAIFFLLPKPPQTSTTQENVISIEEGFRQISQVLLNNGTTFERFHKGDLVLIEDGQLSHDFSASQLDALKTDLSALKNGFARKRDSREKQALLSSIELYLELIELEKNEKELYTSALLLNDKVTDLESGCQNRNAILDVANNELIFSGKLSGLNDKVTDFLLDYAELPKIDLITLDLEYDDIESTYEFFIDAQDIFYVCGIINETEEL